MPKLSALFEVRDHRGSTYTERDLVTKGLREDDLYPALERISRDLAPAHGAAKFLYVQLAEDLPGHGLRRGNMIAWNWAK